MAFRDWIQKVFRREDTISAQKNEHEHLDSPSQTIAPQKKAKSQDIVPVQQDLFNDLPALQQEYKRLCDRLEQLLSKQTDIKAASIPSLPALSYVEGSHQPCIRVFTARKLEGILTMEGIKEARIEEELHNIKLKNQEVTIHLGKASDYMGEGDFVRAADELALAATLIQTLEKSADMERRHKEIQRQLLKRQAENNMIQREKRAQEKQRKKREKEEKLKWKTRLENKNGTIKPGYHIILNDLSDNGIAYFYHFTSRKNLKSIKQHGGLIARAYHSKLGISVYDPVPEEKRQKQIDHINFSEYISLSLCKEHYLAKEMFDAGVDVCILKIKTDVVQYYNTQFADRDTSSERYRMGNSYSDADYINFDAINDDNMAEGDINYVKRFAEVLVDSFIPLDMIENIDNPIKLK